MRVSKDAIAYLMWILLAAATVWVYFAPGITPIPPKKPLGYLPFTIDEWNGVEKPASDYMVAALGADSILLREYRSPSGANVELYMSYFAYTKEKKTPHAPQLCWVGSGWALKDLGEERLALDSEKCSQAVVKKILAQKGDQRILLIYTYKINERYVTDLLSFRVLNVLDSIFKRKSSAFTAQVSSNITGGDFVSQQTFLKRFMSKVLSAAENTLLP
ncbi:MAG: EpsI family protein [Candidatus Omnitrophica bacterium]|nr:EpsI family protein [Candidatus Omnitrophota bacterium]